ncbi:MAG: hypothetical protein M1821_000610 [Bathelium mastoideum]|nr:MAG: hypothetical protein M1821_000610 [Bathelium mastoideum]
MDWQPARASSESDTTIADLSDDLAPVKIGMYQNAALEFSTGTRGADISQDNTRLSSSSTIQGSQDEVPAKTGLPFPFEVRKRIYELLLLSKHVLDGSEDGTPHSYHFHPAILGTSRATREESRPVLYKSNSFVLVKHLDNCFECNLVHFGVPLVSTRNLDHFHEHRLAANFTNPKRHGHADGENICEDCMRDPEFKVCLLLAQDLHFLCRMVKALSFAHGGNYTFIKSARDQRLKSTTTLAKDPEYLIDLEVRPGSFEFPSLEEQKAALEPFRAIHGSANRLNIAGDVDAELARGLKHEMAQSVLWVYAMGWDFMAMACQLKCEANKAITAGNLSHAESKYAVIFSIWGKRILPRDDNGTYQSGQCCDWHQSLTTISFDANYMLGLLALQKGDLQEATLFLVDLLGNAMGTCHELEAMMSHASHFGAILESEKGNYSTAYKVMDDAVTGLPQNPNIQADMSILRAFCSYYCPCEKHGPQSSGPPPPPLTFENSSLSSLPIMNTPFRGRPPTGLVGWQDTDHRLKKKELKRLGLSSVS